MVLRRECAVFCFFFQAEDGIRDHCVTGVQTCALPIFFFIVVVFLSSSTILHFLILLLITILVAFPQAAPCIHPLLSLPHGPAPTHPPPIRRASCRGRGEISVGSRSLKKKKKTIDSRIL